MNEKLEPLEEAMEEVAKAAEERAEAAEEAPQAAPETVEEQTEEAPETPEEKLEEVVSQVGNILAQNIMDDPEASSDDKLLGGLAYLSQIIVPLIVPVIMLVSETSKARPFQRYHAVQSLGFLAAEIVYEVAATIVFTILTAITGGCLGCVLWVLFLIPIIPALYYAYLAYQGKRFDIPYLTQFMREQGWL